MSNRTPAPAEILREPSPLWGGRIQEPSPLWGEGRVRGARSLRKRQTDAGQRLWTRLRDRQLLGFKFRRQHPIGRYIADFCCAEARFVIELDGGQHANDRVRDAERTAILEREGYRVLRFWDNDVFQNLEGVLQRIVEALDPHPSPLPKGEREDEEF
jgi:very-short-patch-repair endonuclease